MIRLHNRRRISAAGLAVLAAAGAFAANTGTAQASPANTDVPQTSAPAAQYSTHDLVDLFAFGSGPVAEQHPDAVQALFGQRPATTPTSEDVDAFTELLRQVDPAFESKVIPGLTSHDPMRTQAALRSFAADTTAVAKQQPAGTDQVARADGTFYIHDNVAISNQAVEAISVVTTVVGALELVGVVFYRFTDGISDLEQSQAVSTVADVFA
ncbi:hypothetical protein [Rhodococcoides fascians]|uniref:hypothetical protein n=1 Tax=Rhodococcoides fascians TaxID=1828 RepID=UPI00050C56B9|nr:hypothetical protein [Rhodococcus fascians]